MNIKKYFLTFIVLATLGAFTACGGQDDTTKDDIYGNDEATQTKVDPKEETETVVESKPSTPPASFKPMIDSNLAQFRTPASGDTVVTLATNYGDIHILMLPEAAPKAVENFVTHGQDNYYDGVIFHRVIEDFMIQGGDPDGTGRGGESIWGQPFEDEFNDSYFPVRGALAMANSGAATNGSQFFIVHSGMTEAKAEEAEAWGEQMENYGFEEAMIEAYKTLGGTPHLFNRHTVFGQVVGGMDVVDAIAAVEINDPQINKPVEDVVIEDVIVTVIE